MAAPNASLAVAPFFRFANLSAQPGLRHAITTRWRPRKLNKQDGNGSANGEQDFASVDLLDYAGDADPPPTSPGGGGVLSPLPMGGAGGGSMLRDSHPLPASPGGEGGFPLPSEGIADFNLGYRALGYEPQATAANWRYLTAALGIEPERIVAARQVHGGKVVRVGAAAGGAGIRLQAWGAAADWRDEAGPAKPPVAEADGLCTNEMRVWLMNVYADCTPLLCYDPRQRAVAVAHAGWRGTTAQIGAEVVAMMTREFGTHPADLLCGIGPSAGPCCYQVSEAVIAAVQAAFPRYADLLNFSSQPDGHAIFDLWAANRRVLEAVGVPPTNIETAAICTIHRNAIFFSARSDGPAHVGRRFAAIIGLL